MTTQMMTVIENKAILVVPKNEGNNAEKKGKVNDFYKLLYDRQATCYLSLRGNFL